MCRRLVLALCSVVAVIAGGGQTGLAQQARWDDRAAIANTVLIGGNGQPVRLGDYRGKVVVIDFWGAWCVPCIADSLPSLKRLQQALAERNRGVAYFFVSAQPGQFKRDATYLKSTGLIGENYRWLNRTAAQYHAFFNTTDAHWWVPTAIVLDSAGNIAKWVRGDGSDWTTAASLFRGLIRDH